MSNAAMIPRQDERLEVVSTLARLREVHPAWQALWEQAGARIFQSPAWVEGWWSTTADQAARELRVVLAWRGEALVAVLPLATRRGWGMRILEWAAYAYSDYCDALLAPGVPGSMVLRLWDKARALGGFDVAMLGHLLPDAHARVLLPEVPQGRDFRRDYRQDTSMRVTGGGGNGEMWFNTFSKKVRQNYRRSVTLLGEKAPMTFRLLGPEEPFEPVLETLASFKRAHLARKGIAAPLFEEGSRTLSALVATLAKAGQLRLFVLEQAGEIIAISVNFQQGDTLMAYVTSYDPETEKGSPGYVLMIDYIRWAFDHGLREVDFLCGSESFKGRLASTSVTLEMMSAPGSLLGATALRLDRLRHLWRSRKLSRLESTGMLHASLAMPLTQCLL